MRYKASAILHKQIMKLEKIENVDSILVSDYDTRYKIEPISPKSLVYSYSRKKILLDGIWNFSTDQYDTIFRQGSFVEGDLDENGMALPEDHSYNYWEEVKVPSTWNLQRRELFHYEGTCWYTREFFYCKNADKKIFLKFNGAIEECRVWLNGEYIGRHLGGSTPFNIDITDKIKEKNRILVSVNNDRKMEGVPAMNTDWYNYGGLIRSVEIFETPLNYIKDFFLRLVPGSDFKEIALDLEVFGNEKTARILIPELKIDKEIPIIDGKGYLKTSENPMLWSPENPKLYDITLEYDQDKIFDKIGFREIRTQNTDILLNGKSIFLKGISAHEESEKNGRSLSFEEIEENLYLAKELGANYIRLAHYPHSEIVARIAEKIGLMVWEEIPVYWKLEFTNKTTILNATSQLEELIRRDRNRCGVILWSVGNENPDSDERYEFMKNLANLAKKLDGSRLTTAACFGRDDRLAKEIDVVGINEYYGWYIRSFEKVKEKFDIGNIQKPVVISETGGGALAGNHGHKLELFTEENQEYIYEKQIETVKECSGIVRGISPWILYDFRSPRRFNKYQKGYNLKGLLNKDKTHKKLSFYVLQNFYKKTNL